MVSLLNFGQVNITLSATIGALVQCFYMRRIIACTSPTSFIDRRQFLTEKLFAVAERPLIKYGVPLVLAPLIVWQFIGLQRE